MQYEKDFFDVLERIAKSLEKINENFEKYMEFKQIEDNNFDPEFYNCVKCGKRCDARQVSAITQKKLICQNCFRY